MFGPPFNLVEIRISKKFSVCSSSLGHHYAIWTSDSILFTGPKKKWRASFQALCKDTDTDNLYFDQLSNSK